MTSASHWRVRLLAALALGVAACGGKDVCFNCPSPTPTPVCASKVTVEGNVVSLSTKELPSVARVVICVGASVGGREGFNACDLTFIDDPDDQGHFERSCVEPGSERIAFYVDRDNPPNGGIHATDDFAELADPGGKLVDVRGGEAVTIEDVAVDFSNEVATAREITVGSRPSPTPAASPTPAPTPSTGS